MSVAQKVFQLLCRGPIYDLPVFIQYLFSYAFGTKSMSIKLVGEEQLLVSLQSGKSIIRIGDGEAMLMTGRDIHYQKTSWSLRTILRTVLDSYSSSSPYILSLPVEGLTSSEGELKTKNRLKIWRLFRSFAALRINREAAYADAHSFYYQEFITKHLPSLLKDKNIICLTKKATYDSTLFGYLQTHAQSVHFIPSPERDAYFEIEELQKAINASLLLQAGSPLLLLAAGPASKALAYKYSSQGVQCIDIGHGIEIVGRDIDYANKV